MVIADSSSELHSLLEMLRRDPANASLRARCMERALAARNFAVATLLVDEWLQSAPDDPRAIFEKATLAIAQRAYSEAVPPLRSLLEKGNRNAAVLSNLGLCLYCVGDFASARSPLEEVYAAGDRSPGLLRLLVSTLHHLALTDEAMAIADANGDAARVDGALAGVYALLYLDSDRATQAARWARVALRANPKSVDGLVVDGTLLVAQMRIEDATERFDQALRIAPESGRAWQGLATIALLKRDLATARELIGRALVTLSGHVGTWHLMAWTQLASGDIDGAEASLQRAATMNRNFAETQGGLATIAAVRGDTKTAEQLIEVATRLDPACLSVTVARAMLARSGKPADVQALLTQSIGGIVARDSSALGRELKGILER